MVNTQSSQSVAVRRCSLRTRAGRGISRCPIQPVWETFRLRLPWDSMTGIQCPVGTAERPHRMIPASGRNRCLAGWTVSRSVPARPSRGSSAYDRADGAPSGNGEGEETGRAPRPTPCRQWGIVPESRFAEFADRLAELKVGRDLFTFLATRWSGDFLRFYLSTPRGRLDELTNPPSYLSGSAEVRLLARLHDFGLLPEEWRRGLTGALEPVYDLVKTNLD